MRRKKQSRPRPSNPINLLRQSQPGNKSPNQARMMVQKVKRRTLKRFLFRAEQATLWLSQLDSDRKQTNKKLRSMRLNHAKNTSTNFIWISRVNWRLDLTEEKSQLLQRKKSLRRWILCRLSKMWIATPRTLFPGRSLSTWKGTQSWFQTPPLPSYLSMCRLSRAPLTLCRDNGPIWESTSTLLPRPTCSSHQWKTPTTFGWKKSQWKPKVRQRTTD